GFVGTGGVARFGAEAPTFGAAVGHEDDGAFGVVRGEGGDIDAIGAAGRAPGRTARKLCRLSLGFGVLPVAVDGEPGAPGGRVGVGIEVSAAPEGDPLHPRFADEVDLLPHDFAPAVDREVVGSGAEMGVFVEVQADFVARIFEVGEDAG